MVTFSFPETAVTGETYTVKVDYPRSVDNRATQAVVNMTAVDKSQLAQPVISGLSLAVDPSDETSGTVTVSWNAVEGRRLLPALRRRRTEGGNRFGQRPAGHWRRLRRQPPDG